MKQKKDLLKSFFETRDYPKQSNYEDLTDSFHHKNDENPIRLGGFY